MEIVSASRARSSFAQASPVPVAHSKKTVFLIHSSPRLQSPFKAALLEKGYQVIHAESVEAALRIWARLSVPVDLFLADISLGKDQGVEQLVKLLQNENRRMRVLFANGLEETAAPIAGQTYSHQLMAVIGNCLA